MTIKEKLTEEFVAAIIAIFGTVAEEEFEQGKVDAGDLELIKKKVAFYMDLD